MNFDLTPEQQAAQEMARRFAREEVAPVARQADEDGAFPRQLIPRMAELGLLGGPLPRAYGGHGFDYVSYALIYEEVGWACSSVRGFLAVHVGLVAMCIHDWGSEEQKRAYLPRLARGEYVGCYALTEPNAGSDVAGMEATACREGDHYVLNGTKVWITNGNMAHLALVFASEDRSLKHRGISAFIVPTDAPGFERERMEGRELGHRASDHARITLADCRVPASALLGRPGDGFRVAMGALNHGRLGVAAGAVGVAQACLDHCVEFARRRVQFGRPIGDFQLIQGELAEMATLVDAARLLVYRAAAQKAAGLENPKETSMAKFYATEVAMQVASRAVSLLGSYGYSNLRPVERHFRDIKGYQIYEGTSHIQRLVIARQLLKEAAAREGEGGGGHAGGTV